MGFVRPSTLTEVFQRGGGAEGNRTPDLRSAIAALSHLSYGPGLKGRSSDGAVKLSRNRGHGPIIGRVCTCRWRGATLHVGPRNKIDWRAQAE